MTENSHPIGMTTTSNFESVAKPTPGQTEFQIRGDGLDLQHQDLGNAAPWQLVGLAYLILFLLVKPRYSHARFEQGFWVVCGLVTYFALWEVTWLPFMTTLVSTRTGYPYLVVIPHCITANASYRQVQGTKGTDRWQALLGSFFLYGFGGSIVSDVLMGLPATALAHPRIIPCHVLGWYLVWFAPLDWIYRSYSTKQQQHFFRWTIIVMEAVDAVTTPMGRVARAAREFKNNTSTAPIAAGILAGTGGVVLRWMAGIHGCSVGAVSQAFYKTLGYAILFWTVAVWRCDQTQYDQDPTFLDENHCVTYSGSDWWRLVIVSAHVVWTILCELGVAKGHPFLFLSERLFHGPTTNKVLSQLQFGPSSVDDDVDDHEKMD